MASRRPGDIARRLGVAGLLAGPGGKIALSAPLAVDDLALIGEGARVEIGGGHAAPADIAHRRRHAQANRACRDDGQLDPPGRGSLRPEARPQGIASHERKSPPSALSTGYA